MRKAKALNRVYYIEIKAKLLTETVGNCLDFLLLFQSI